MYFDLFARLLLVIGGLNYFFTSTINVNLFSFIQQPMFVRILSTLIGISALYLVFNRDYYLPFLGHTVIPISSRSKPSENLKQIKLTNLPPNTIVIAWGSQESDKTFENPFEAYGDYVNTDIKTTNDKGEVIIELSCP